MGNLRFTRRDDADVSCRDVKSLHGGGRFANCDDAQSYADGGETAPSPEEAQPADPVGEGLAGLVNFVRGHSLSSNPSPGNAQLAAAQQAQAQSMMAPQQAQAPQQAPPPTDELVPEALSPQSHTPVPQQAARAAGPAGIAGGGRSTPVGQIQAALDLASDIQIRGLANQANAKAAQAKANGIATDAFIQQQQAIQEKYTKAFEDNQARAEQVRQSILDNPIDANRVWNNASVAGQMSALVGMAMGATAGAMSGRGGNQVADMVNKVIDRDLVSQEANLSSKQGLLSYHLQNGNQIQQARQLAKADALTMFGSQLEANAYKTAPGQIQAQALQQAGQIMQQAQAMRLNVAETAAKIDLTRAETTKDYIANGMAAMELNWLRGQGGQGGGGGQAGVPGVGGPSFNDAMAAKVYGPQVLGAQVPGIGTVWNEGLRKQISDTMPSLIQAHRSLDVLQQNPETLGKLLAGTVGASSGQANINSQLENLRAQMPLIAQAAPGRMRAKLTEAMVPHARELLMPSGQQKLQDLRDTLGEVFKSWQTANGSGQ